MNERERDNAVDGDHTPSIANPCDATDGKHHCDLSPAHVGHGRHMCVCGRFFG